MEAPLIIIGTTLIALGQLVRVRAPRARKPRQRGLDHRRVGPADELTVAGPSPPADTSHFSLLTVFSLIAVTLGVGVLLYAVAG